MNEIDALQDQHGHTYYQHRRTGQTAWTREELLPAQAPPGPPPSTLPSAFNLKGAPAAQAHHDGELAGTWSQAETALRQKLEQRMREKPKDCAITISLATLFAAKNNPERAQALIDRAAVHVPTDEHAAVLLRKLAIAHIALWKADRQKPGNPEYVNGSDSRKANLDKAMVLFDQALMHPENNNSPVALGEMATTRMHQGQLKPALKEFGQIIQQYPTYDKLNSFIFRAAVMLKFHGSLDQSLRYLEYLLDDPPTLLGYGDLEVQLLVAVTCEAAHYDMKSKHNFATAEKEWVNLGYEAPPANQEFATWPVVYRMLADKALNKCDYVLAVVLLEELLSLEPTITGYVQLGECLTLFGELGRALGAFEAAYEADPDNQTVREALIELAPTKWETKLDAAAAERQQKELEERAQAVRQAEVGMRGQHLREALERKRKLGVLRQWQRNWMVAFAQAQLARQWRGHKGREYAAEVKREYLEHEAIVKACVFKVTRHLMKHVLEQWSEEVKWRHQRRQDILTPALARHRKKRRKQAVRAWVDLHRKQKYARNAVRKALLQPPDKFGLTPVFYSEELAALSRMAQDKPIHEERNRRVLAGESLEGLPPIVRAPARKPKPAPPTFKHYNIRGEYQPYVSPFPSYHPPPKEAKADPAPSGMLPSLRPGLKFPTLGGGTGGGSRSGSPHGSFRSSPPGSRPGSASGERSRPSSAERGRAFMSRLGFGRPLSGPASPSSAVGLGPTNPEPKPMSR